MRERNRFLEGGLTPNNPFGPSSLRAFRYPLLDLLDPLYLPAPNFMGNASNERVDVVEWLEEGAFVLATGVPMHWFVHLGRGCEDNGQDYDG